MLNTCIEMSESEYASFLAKQQKKKHINDANRREDGTVIDVNEYISAGFNILSDLKEDINS